MLHLMSMFDVISSKVEGVTPYWSYPVLMRPFTGGGEGEAAAPEVHVTRAAEGDQEGAGYGEGRQGRHRGQVQGEAQGETNIIVIYVLGFPRDKRQIRTFIWPSRVPITQGKIGELSKEFSVRENTRSLGMLPKYRENTCIF